MSFCPARIHAAAGQLGGLAFNPAFGRGSLVFLVYTEERNHHHHHHHHRE
jgi:glycerol uptake facilitator-like aquaporin